MAGFLTAFIEYMSDLGIGAAVIQKHEITKKELSSLFWVSMGVGLFMALIALGLAYPTANIFHDKRIIPVTSLISINFIIGSLASIPNGILRRDFKFKQIGIANMTATITSCLCQIYFASKGWGVYTLVVGVIILRATRTLMAFIFAEWLPLLHFKFVEIKSYLKFGLGLAGGAAAYRLYESLDKFIVGKKFDATILGNYGFAMSLANLPLDKILPVFQQVTFPLLARLQGDKEDRNRMFLNNLKFCLYLSAPLLIGGTFLSHDIIMGFLGQKWLPIVTMFRIFCLVKLFELVRSFVGILFTSTGDSRTPLIFNLLLLVIMPLSIFIASFYGAKFLIVPWATIFPVMATAWIIFTLKKYNINGILFLKAVFKPILFGLLFTGCSIGVKTAIAFAEQYVPEPRFFLIGYLGIGLSISLLFFPLFEKETVLSFVASLRKKLQTA